MELDAFLLGDELLKSSQSAAEKMGPQALLQQLLLEEAEDFVHL